MKIRILAAGFAIVSGLSAGGLVISSIWSKDPVPPGLAAATNWSPPQLPLPASIKTEIPQFAQPHAEPAIPLQSMPRLEVAMADTLLPTIEPPLSNWSRDIATGETLDTILEEAGLSATDRAEVALALGAEYDLRRLGRGTRSLLSRRWTAARAASRSPSRTVCGSRRSLAKSWPRRS